MQLSKGPQDRIKEYLDEVSCHMGDMPSEERTDTLQYLKEHIDASLGKLDVDSPTIEDLETVISEMASPDSYGQEKVEGEKKPGFLLPIVLGFVLLLVAIVAISISHKNFKDKSGTPAEPYDVGLRTSTVTGGEAAIDAPKIVNIFPKNGDMNVDPSAKEFYVRFDREMGGGFSWCGGLPRDMEGKIGWDKDKKTCRVSVKLEPNKEYSFWINTSKFRNFADKNGIPVEPVAIRFRTGSGEPDNVLQKLIDVAKPNSVVTVPKGIYTEPIVIEKPLTLKGVSRDECIIEVTDNYPAILVDAAAETQVHIEGLTVKWQLATSDSVDFPHAIAAKDATVHVENCSVLPLGNHSGSPIAIMALGFANLRILNSSFEGFDYTICYGEGTKGVVRNVTVRKPASQGIILYRGANVDVSESIFADSGKHGVRSTGGTLNLRSSLIINNANRGIYLGNKSAAGRISDNILMANATGISGFSGSTVEIANNLIIDSSYAAIDMRGSCKLTIENNIIQGNPRGIALYSDKGENENTVKGNTFWKNKQDTENIELKNIISTDPLFKNLQDGDFTLQDGPAKAAGHGPRNHQQLNKLWMRYKNADANPAEESKAESVESSSNPFKDCTEVKYDSGKSNGKQSYGGRYPAVKIDVSDIIAKAGGSDKVFLAGLKMYASRYGVDYKPEETFMKMSVLSNEGTDHANSKYPFSLFSFSEKWVDLVLSEVISLNRYVDDNGMITIALDPEAGRHKGIYFHFTSHPDVYHALVGRIDSGFEKIDDRQWMIRAFFKTK